MLELGDKKVFIREDWSEGETKLDRKAQPLEEAWCDEAGRGGQDDELRWSVTKFQDREK